VSKKVTPRSTAVRISEIAFCLSGNAGKLELSPMQPSPIAETSSFASLRVFTLVLLSTLLELDQELDRLPLVHRPVRRLSDGPGDTKLIVVRAS